MKKAASLIVVACVLFNTPAVTSQRKHSRPKPKPPVYKERNLAPIPEDENLFGKYGYLILPGWRFVANSTKDSQNRQTLAYYDRYRIVKGKESIRAWVKYIEKKDDIEQAYTLALEEFDCTGRRSRTLESADYNKDGKPLSSSSIAGGWSHIIPDSMNEEFYSVICEGAVDQEEYDMRQAAKDFMLGRQSEKSDSLEEAQIYYEAALALAPDNSKIRYALARVRAKLKMIPVSKP